MEPAGNEKADALAKLVTSKDRIDAELCPSKAQVRNKGKVLLATNGKKDEVIQQKYHGPRNFSKKLNSIDYAVTSTITKC
ncbi:hypothetical protein AVEN_41453-1 [Araneus ventricosus]|uniref:Uncharacterized protein n=1 Tax=Araneus ventricosus TaxID=182803 RepID=A0A4Y2F491_ARAVE|nr:hypothetical protein AVEN_41453-1 [Araneus ventricosus]